MSDKVSKFRICCKYCGDDFPSKGLASHERMCKRRRFGSYRRVTEDVCSPFNFQDWLCELWMNPCTCIARFVMLCALVVGLAGSIVNFAQTQVLDPILSLGTPIMVNVFTKFHQAEIDVKQAQRRKDDQAAANISASAQTACQGENCSN